MSSFVIEKEHYAKAAGFIAGLASIPGPGGTNNLWLYNYAQRKPYAPEDFYKAFMWLYELNRKSVAIQYGEEITGDSGNYKAVFTEYWERTKRNYMNFESIIKSIYDLHSFLESVLYQIEDEDCERAAKGFIYRLMFAVDAIPARRCHDMQERNPWGEFEL